MIITNKNSQIIKKGLMMNLKTKFLKELGNLKNKLKYKNILF